MSNGTSISEIFDLDPIKLTKNGEEMKAIVAYYREKRLQFKMGDKTAGSTKTMAKSEKKDLGALDLEL